MEESTNIGTADKAAAYLDEGCNCAQCVLMAFGEIGAARLCGGVSRGFGYGGLCGALVGAAIALGRDEYGAKAKALALISDFWEEYGSADCAEIRRKNGDDCDGVIRRVAELTEKYIER